MIHRWRYLLLPVVVLCLFALVSAITTSADTPTGDSITHVIDAETAPTLAPVVEIPAGERIAEGLCPCGCGRLFSEVRTCEASTSPTEQNLIEPTTDHLDEGRHLSTSATGAPGVQHGSTRRADIEATFTNGRFTGAPSLSARRA